MRSAHPGRVVFAGFVLWAGVAAANPGALHPTYDQNGIAGGTDVAVSPDGRHAYVGSGGLIVATRDRRTGALRRLAGSEGCVVDLDAPGNRECSRALGVEAYDVAVSGDGRNVYAAGLTVATITAFSRDRQTGALEQLPGAAGCLSGDGRSGCTDSPVLERPLALALSPDGRSLYAVTQLKALLVFRRDPNSGALEPAGCLSADPMLGCDPVPEGDVLRKVTVSPDGRHVYTAGTNGPLLFERDRATGALTAIGLAAGCVGDRESLACRSTDDIAVSPDGRHAYSATDALVAFQRDRITGRLHRIGCYGSPGGECVSAPLIGTPSALALSPDGRSVYHTSEGGDSVTAFDRDPRSGTLEPLPGKEACVREVEVEVPFCTSAPGLRNNFGATVSPDGRTVYVASTRPEDNLSVLAREQRRGRRTLVGSSSAADGGTFGVWGRTRLPRR